MIIALHVRALAQLHTVSTRKVQHELDLDLVELEVEVGSARPKSRLRLSAAARALRSVGATRG